MKKQSRRLADRWKRLWELELKAEGCISVEMECSALQTLCDFRELNLYMFLTCGDLLDAPKHLFRNGDGQYQGTQHDAGHFEIALSLAEYIAQK